jgi:hypothetical protein
VPTNLTFLIGRTPLVVPHGILPDGFIPLEGSVYDSFAPGLPAVIYINSQFYPLTEEELDYLKQESSRVSSGGGRGPEGMPQMPTSPSNFEQQVDNVRNFEQKLEKAAEKKAETPPAQPSTPQPQTAPATTSTTVPKPVLVNVDEIIGPGKSLINQAIVDDSFQKYKQGRLKAKADAGEETIEWLKLLLLKIFQTQDKRKSKDK